MKISEKLNSGKINISLEVFPPKTSDTYDKVQDAVDKIGALKPAFISVTYGAGGGTSKNTLKIAKHIKDDLGVDSLAHLTCASSTKEEVCDVIGGLKDAGIENILALRGDIPEGGSLPGDDSFKPVSELIQEIQKQGDFCIGGACYPEGHVENAHKADDIGHLKEKVEGGGDFLTTQMFFTILSTIIFFTESVQRESRFRYFRNYAGDQWAPDEADRQLSGTHFPQDFRRL